MGNCENRVFKKMKSQTKKPKKSVSIKCEEEEKRVKTETTLSPGGNHYTNNRNLFGTFSDWTNQNPPNNLFQIESNAAKKHLGSQMAKSPSAKTFQEASSKQRSKSSVKLLFKSGQIKPIKEV